MTAGWIASSSDLVRLLDTLAAAAAASSRLQTTSTTWPLLAPSSVDAMLDRPSYDQPVPGEARTAVTGCVRCHTRNAVHLYC